MLAVILVLTTVVSYWYYLRVAWFMWMKEATTGEGPGAADGTPLATQIVLVVGVALIVLGGLFPGAALDLAADSVDGLRQVMGGAAAGAGY